ncbi:MAG: NIPSNAP family protein [Planctomycetota bacterium]|nr:NIPSNAP family protein [Planctomycetota bacterium]
MTRFLLSLATVLLLGTSVMTESATAEVFELRIYTTNEGKLDNLHARFRDHTLKLFEKHGMTNMGYWVPEGSKDTLIYVLSHKSREAATKSWDGFRNDPAWQKAFEASRVDGPLLSKSPESTFLKATDYTPKKKWKHGNEGTLRLKNLLSRNRQDNQAGFFELRIYQAAEGKLGKLDARFRDHTIDLFEKHGMKNLAYWHAMDEPQSKDHLYYIIWHESKEAADASWKGFIADPDWKAAAAASGVGRLAKPPTSIYMQSTDYSKIK